MTDIKDRAYGGIIFKIINGTTHVLLVKKPQYKGWDLPKGHRKDDDKSELDTVMREIGEETGYWKIKILERVGSIEYTIFDKPNNFRKEVIFYKGEHLIDETPNPKRDSIENKLRMAAEWIPITEAFSKLIYPPFKGMLYASLVD